MAVYNRIITGIFLALNACELRVVLFHHCVFIGLSVRT